MHNNRVWTDVVTPSICNIALKVISDSLRFLGYWNKHIAKEIVLLQVNRVFLQVPAMLGRKWLLLSRRRNKIHEAFSFLDANYNVLEI